MPNFSNSKYLHIKRIKTFRTIFDRNSKPQFNDHFFFVEKRNIPRNNIIGKSEINQMKEIEVLNDLDNALVEEERMTTSEISKIYVRKQ